MIKEYTIQSKNKKDDYSVVLYFIDGVLIPQKCSCTCLYGSMYRFTQANLALNKWDCSHIQEAIKKYKNGEKDNIENEKEEQNGKNNTREIYPIFQ